MLDSVIQLDFEQFVVMTGLFMVGFVYASFFKNYRAALLFILLLWLSWGLCGHLILEMFGWQNAKPLNQFVIVLLPINILLLSVIPNHHNRSISSMAFLLLLAVQLTLLYVLPEDRLLQFVGQYTNLINSFPIKLQIMVHSVSVLILSVAVFIFFLRWHQTDRIMELMLSLMSCLFVAGYYEASIYYLCIISGAALVMLAQLYQSHRMAFVDALTGLYNRRGLDVELKTLKKQYAIAMMDVDHFKKINDRHGHDLGDQVLKMIATRAKRVHKCHVYRYGGEEFCLIFKGRQFAGAEDACEEIRAEIGDRPIVIRSRYRPPSKPRKSKQSKDKVASLKVTVSIGLVMSLGQSDANEVIEMADKSLYKAKKTGRNKVVTRKS